MQSYSWVAWKFCGEGDITLQNGSQPQKKECNPFEFIGQLCFTVLCLMRYTQRYTQNS